MGTKDFFKPYGYSNLTYICEKINDFKNIESNWNYGIGELISSETIKSTMQLISILAVANSDVFNNLKLNAMPNTDGGITLSLGKGDEFIELVVNTDSTYDLIYEKGIGVKFVILNETFGIPQNKPNELINYFFRLCKLSELSTLDTMMSTESDLPASHSKIMEVASRSSTWNVQCQRVEEMYAPI
jgi:hypothetical protein